MSSYNFHSHIALAQAKRFEADKENSLAVRVKLLNEASQEYLRGCDEVDDQLFKEALAILANDALNEAWKWKQILLSKNPRTDLNSQLLRKDNEYKWSIHANRLIATVHSDRVRGLTEIPKMTTPSLSDAAKDLLDMEVKLAGLGFRKNHSSHGSANIPASQVLPPNNSLHESRHMYSTLGESFMVLDENHNVGNVDIKLEHLVGNILTNPPITTGTASPNQSPVGVYAVTSLLNDYLGRLVSQRHFSSNTLEGENQAWPNSDIQHDAIQWNEQSTFLGKQTDNIKHSPPETEFNVAANATNEGIARLLATITTLHDENVRLEQENQLMSTKMEEFRKEFSTKFKNLKRYLDDYKDAYPPEKNPFKLPDGQESVEKLHEDLDKATERRSQLEKALYGVLEKYNLAKEEIRRKSDLLDRLCDISKSIQPDVDQHVKSLCDELVQYRQAKFGHQRGAARSMDNIPQNYFSGSNYGRPPTISKADLPKSMETSGQLNALSSPNALYSKKQSLHSSQRNKHPSTITLESLQKTSKLSSKT